MVSNSWLIVNNEFGNTWEQQWPNLRNHAGICMKGLRKTMKSVSQDCLCPSTNVNQSPL